MASWQSILAVVGGGLFVWWFINKGGCQGDGNLTGEGTALCYTGPSIDDFLGGLNTGGGEDVPGQVEDQESPEEEAEDRNEARQITSAERRGAVSRSQTSDPVSTGGGVGGPSRKVKGFGITPASRAAWAHSYLIQNSITLA